MGFRNCPVNLQSSETCWVRLNFCTNVASIQIITLLDLATSEMLIANWLFTSLVSSIDLFMLLRRWVRSAIWEAVWHAASWKGQVVVLFWLWTYPLPAVLDRAWLCRRYSLCMTPKLPKQSQGWVRMQWCRNFLSDCQLGIEDLSEKAMRRLTEREAVLQAQSSMNLL